MSSTIENLMTYGKQRENAREAIKMAKAYVDSTMVDGVADAHSSRMLGGVSTRLSRGEELSDYENLWLRDKVQWYTGDFISPEEFRRTQEKPIPQNAICITTTILQHTADMLDAWATDLSPEGADPEFEDPLDMEDARFYRSGAAWIRGFLNLRELPTKDHDWNTLLRLMKTAETIPKEFVVDDIKYGLQFGVYILQDPVV